MTLRRLLRRTTVSGLAAGIVSLLLGRGNASARDDSPLQVREGIETVSLPPPETDGDVAVERAIANRRSRREYAATPITRRELSQLLWAVQGITDPESGYRAAPSAGARYPLEVYVVVGDPGVDGLDAGVYRYRPEPHDLALSARGNVQAELRAAAVGQEPVGRAAIDVVICAVDERTTREYGERGRLRYVPMEAGHVGENLYLQAEALDLSTVAIGSFRDRRVRTLVDASPDCRPLYIYPVGARA
ncbi:SagB/ThcOx family dehydrogenase [Natribaculum luteum]|uniref:SagB/ThcOx family dehydrogenase n=1 Tax=Natribaculum luteum TaxID=1586232 RepID=A0ABD5P025_9EURY|nr:SagB/ThcOx family dehydrogenase [Natribaculum luteum]